jgi:hypothetical protein
MHGAQVNNDESEIRKYLLNSLNNLKTKMKTLTICVGNPNNYAGYSILSKKSETIESGLGFMGTDG